MPSVRTCWSVSWASSYCPFWYCSRPKRAGALRSRTSSRRPARRRRRPPGRRRRRTGRRRTGPGRRASRRPRAGRLEPDRPRGRSGAGSTGAGSTGAGAASAGAGSISVGWGAASAGAGSAGGPRVSRGRVGRRGRRVGRGGGGAAADVGGRRADLVLGRGLQERAERGDAVGGGRGLGRLLGVQPGQPRDERGRHRGREAQGRQLPAAPAGGRGPVVRDEPGVWDEPVVRADEATERSDTR